MRVLHQCGHNTIWNIDSFEKENVGDGLIISPINIAMEKVADRISEGALRQSFFDPQFYLPYEPTSNLASYDFFPANVITDNSTNAIGDKSNIIAKKCVDFQEQLQVQYYLITTRFTNNLTANFYENLDVQFVEPFLAEIDRRSYNKPALLTAIVQSEQLKDESLRNDILSWLTKYESVDGIYLIFYSNTASKNINDIDFLVEAINFIKILKDNELEVHIGYSGLEGVLYSVADPTSVTMGSYDNLKSFGIARLEMEKKRSGAPTPRVFSDSLIQSVPVTLMPAFDKLYENWRDDLMPASTHIDALLESPENLHFTRPEIYKHYFEVFSKLVSGLPVNVKDRMEHIDSKAKKGIALFESITEKGIVLDANSGGDHLIAWRNTIAMLRK